MRLRTAVPFLLVCAVVGALLGSLPLPVPEQLVGSAPWVSDVPPVLLGLVVVTGLVLLAVAVALLRGPIRHRLDPVRLGLVALGSLLACGVAGWSTLYLATLGDGEAIIPIFDWTWPAFATAVGAGVVSWRWGVRAGLAAGLTAVAPVVALDALGWALVGGSALRSLAAVGLLDGFGIVLGSLLSLLGTRARPARTPLPSQQAPSPAPQ